MCYTYFLLITKELFKCLTIQKGCDIIIVTEYERAVRLLRKLFNREERNRKSELLRCPRNRKNVCFYPLRTVGRIGAGMR